MVKFLLAVAFVMNFVSVSRGQDSGLRLCHADQINWAEDASPQIEALGQQLATVRTTDDFLQYSQDQLAFRQDIWGAPPLCNPYLEAGVIISRYMNDIVSLGAIEWLGVMQEDSPRLQHVTQTGWNVGGLLVDLASDYLSLLASPDPRAEQSDGTLPICADGQLQALRAAKTDDYTAILRAAYAVETVDDLLRYDAEQLAFREKIWNDLPPCAEAFTIAPRMLHISGDFLTAHALAFAGVLLESNPFYWQLERDIRRLPSWLFDAMGTTPELTRQVFESNLPACTPAQLAQIAAIEPPFEADRRHLADLMETDNMVAVREYALTEIRWRSERMSLFPPCAESVELALVMSSLGSDMVSAIALDLASSRQVPNHYRMGAASGVAKLEELIRELSAVSETASGAQHEAELPGCTIVQIESVARTIMNPFDELVDVLASVESVRGFYKVANAHWLWRESIFERLPPCAEAIEIALFLSQLIGSLVAMDILEYGGLRREENPYIEELTTVVPLYKQIINKVKETLALP